MKVLYRYEKRLYSENLLNEDGNSNVKLRLIELNIISETPKGFWFIFNNKRKWTSNNSKKRFAYPTKKEALHNFKKRTNRSVLILKHRIEFSKLALKEAEKLVL